MSDERKGVRAQVQVRSRRRGGRCQTRVRREAPRRRPRLRRPCSSPRLDATRKTGAFGDVRWDLAGGLLAGLLEAVSKALGGRLRASFGPLFVLLGASWGGLGASVGRPGALLGRKAGLYRLTPHPPTPCFSFSGYRWARWIPPRRLRGAVFWGAFCASLNAVKAQNVVYAKRVRFP